MTSETIYALSTVLGKSGVAVVRISGPQVKQVISEMTDINFDRIKPRYAYFCELHHAKTKNALDKCLLLFFKGPASFTGEDIIELHNHGSRAVISSVLESLSTLPGFRLAEPGEFSKRAFYNGKMDLTEAEGLADLIDAETQEQQKFALRQMEGGLKNLYNSWRSSLLESLSHLEAFIDFPDEILPPAISENIQNNVFKLKNDINKHLSSDNIGERLREGFRVAIVGEPNAGKSSLLNTLVNREAVIVSEIAGTTRDAVDIYLDLKGYPVVFTDTAGLREASDEIEQQGIAIAYRKAEEADLIICLFDAEKDSVQLFDNINKTFKNKMLFVANKCDKLTSEQCSDLIEKNCIPISAKFRNGIDLLLQKIHHEIEQRFTDNSSLLITRRRYREALQDAVHNLEMFNLNKEIELAAEDLRLVARALGKITGQIEVDEILDKIFGDFCIGK